MDEKEGGRIADMENVFLTINIITIGALLLSIVYTAGIVWRVEMKLDISYKFLLAAVIFIVLAELVDSYYGFSNVIFWSFIVKALRMLFAVSFLAGVLFMRNIVRSLDGEK